MKRLGQNLATDLLFTTKGTVWLVYQSPSTALEILHLRIIDLELVVTPTKISVFAFKDKPKHFVPVKNMKEYVFIKLACYFYTVVFNFPSCY